MIRTPFLFIDIDNTITCQIAGSVLNPANELLGQSVLGLMREMAIREKGMAAEKAEAIIRNIHDSMPWWHWSDFLRALDLDGYLFWEYAYAVESSYLAPVCKDLPAIVKALYDADYKMFITSNNPSSSILHKLRIAGLAEIWGSKYFVRYFGPPELHQMKRSPEYWRCALAHAGLQPRQVTVIGDDAHDDIEAPMAAGIRSRIHLDAGHEVNSRSDDGVWRVRTWHDIADLLLSPARGVACETFRPVTKPMRSYQPVVPRLAAE